MHAFDVLGDPVRRRILELLAGGELTAGAVSDAIRAEFGISQPAVSMHLRVLRESGFASVRPDGARRLYAVHPEPLRDVDAWLERFRRFWGPPLDALQTELARGERERRHAGGSSRRGSIAPRANNRKEIAVIDATHQINATRRTVGTRVHEVGNARTVTVCQTYDAALEDVWDACTNPERIPRWFLPVSGELRVGGRYQLEGNASGIVERCDPPTSFSSTWEFGGDVTWIEVCLTSEGERRTRLELEHIAHVDDRRWAEFGPGAVGVGWDMALVGLAIHLESGGSVDREQAAAWVASPEGRRFIELSSARWREASVAAGEDADQAAGAAERTFAFYTGGG